MLNIQCFLYLRDSFQQNLNWEKELGRGSLYLIRYTFSSMRKPFPTRILDKMIDLIWSKVLTFNDSPVASSLLTKENQNVLDCCQKQFKGKGDSNFTTGMGWVGAVNFSIYSNFR